MTPPLVVNIKSMPQEETGFKEVDVGHCFARIVHQIRRMSDVVSQDSFYADYGALKRKRLMCFLKEVKDELDGIPVVLEHKAWYKRSQLVQGSTSLLPGDKRFPHYVHTNKIVVGSWVTLKGAKYVVIGVEFLFRGKHRKTFAHLRGKLLTRNGTRVFSCTAPLYEIEPLSVPARLSFASVRNPLVSFFSMLREHCKFKPGSLGFLQAQENFYATSSSQM